MHAWFFRKLVLPTRACQRLPTGVQLLLQDQEVKLVLQTQLKSVSGNIHWQRRNSHSWLVTSPRDSRLCQKVSRKNRCRSFRRTYGLLTPQYGENLKTIFHISDSARLGVCCFSDHLFIGLLDNLNKLTSGAPTARKKGHSVHGRRAGSLKIKRHHPRSPITKKTFEGTCSLLAWESCHNFLSLSGTSGVVEVNFQDDISTRIFRLDQDEQGNHGRNVALETPTWKSCWCWGRRTYETFKAYSLDNSSLVSSTGPLSQARCHQQSAPALLLQKLSYHEHHHGTRRLLQTISAGVIGWPSQLQQTGRAPLLRLWTGGMLPREVQTSSFLSECFQERKSQGLLDSPFVGWEPLPLT